MKLTDPVRVLPRTSALTIKKMNAAGLFTIRDLLFLKPNRYEDYRKNITAATLQDADEGTCAGVVTEVKQLYTRSRITIQQVCIQDTTGTINIQFFNQRFLLQTVRKGMILSCAGQVRKFGSKLTFTPATYEIGNSHIHTGRLLPIYPELKGMSTRLLREKIYNAIKGIEDIEEYLPNEIVSQFHLLPLHEALMRLHVPLENEDISRSTERLAFDELLKIQVATKRLRVYWNQIATRSTAPLTKQSALVIDTFIRSLPFTLTTDQLSAFRDIQADFADSHRMNRFIQGDVGSGKTIVAVLAALHMHLCGEKSVYMAPTEILAQQQYNTFSRLLGPIGITTSLVTGSHKSSKNTTADIIVGTHALLTRITQDRSIGLAIIDEQHRFGVKQRALLSHKGEYPHLLTMTATPIPRTVALTVFGDLDMSVISTMPSGRKDVKTLIVSEIKRNDAYQWMREKVTSHKEQIFVVCPLIEGSTSETLQSIKSVILEYERLKKDVFPHISVGLLHGKMKSIEKEQVISAFAKGTVSVLVSTSVVEVGIDIPNATIMCIEGAERFGLAQLHQLRGRVGRSTKQSYCLLFPTNPHIPSQRLEYFTRHSKGIELAEYDLKSRGPGSLYGFEQHGHIDTQFTDLSNVTLIQATQKAAEYLLTHWDEKDYPEFFQTLISKQNELIAKD